MSGAFSFNDALWGDADELDELFDSQAYQHMTAANLTQKHSHNRAMVLDSGVTPMDTQYPPQYQQHISQHSFQDAYGLAGIAPSPALMQRISTSRPALATQPILNLSITPSIPQLPVTSSGEDPNPQTSPRLLKRRERKRLQAQRYRSAHADEVQQGERRVMELRRQLAELEQENLDLQLRSTVLANCLQRFQAMYNKLAAWQATTKQPIELPSGFLCAPSQMKTPPPVQESTITAQEPTRNIYDLPLPSSLVLPPDILDVLPGVLQDCLALFPDPSPNTTLPSSSTSALQSRASMQFSSAGASPSALSDGDIPSPSIPNPSLPSALPMPLSPVSSNLYVGQPQSRATDSSDAAAVITGAYSSLPATTRDGSVFAAAITGAYSSLPASTYSAGTSASHGVVLTSGTGTKGAQGTSLGFNLESEQPSSNMRLSWSINASSVGGGRTSSSGRADPGRHGSRRPASIGGYVLGHAAGGGSTEAGTSAGNLPPAGSSSPEPSDPVDGAVSARLEPFKQKTPAVVATEWSQFVLDAAAALSKYESEGCDTGAMDEMMRVYQASGQYCMDCAAANMQLLSYCWSLNLETVEAQVPPLNHWRNVVEALKLNDEQIQQAVLAYSWISAQFEGIPNQAAAVCEQLEMLDSSQASPSSKLPPFADFQREARKKLPDPQTSSEELHGQLLLITGKYKTCINLSKVAVFTCIMDKVQGLKALVYSYPFMPDATAMLIAAAERGRMQGRRGQ